MERKTRRKRRKLGEGLLQSAGVESVREAEERISLLLESFQMSSDRTPDSSQSPKGHISLRRWWTSIVILGGVGTENHSVPVLEVNLES